MLQQSHGVTITVDSYIFPLENVPVEKKLRLSYRLLLSRLQEEVPLMLKATIIYIKADIKATRLILKHRPNYPNWMKFWFTSCDSDWPYNLTTNYNLQSNLQTNNRKT